MRWSSILGHSITGPQRENRAVWGHHVSEKSFQRSRDRAARQRIRISAKSPSSAGMCRLSALRTGDVLDPDEAATRLMHGCSGCNRRSGRRFGKQ